MFDRLNVCARELFLEALKIIKSPAFFTYVLERFSVFVFLTKAFALFVGQSHHDLWQQKYCWSWTNDLPQCNFFFVSFAFGCVLSSLLIHYDVGSVRQVHCKTIYWLNEISTLALSVSHSNCYRKKLAQNVSLSSCVGDKLSTFSSLLNVKWTRVAGDKRRRNGVIDHDTFFWYEGTLDSP